MGVAASNIPGIAEMKPPTSILSLMISEQIWCTQTYLRATHTRDGDRGSLANMDNWHAQELEDRQALEQAVLQKQLGEEAACIQADFLAYERHCSWLQTSQEGLRSPTRPRLHYGALPAWLKSHQPSPDGGLQDKHHVAVGSSQAWRQKSAYNSWKSLAARGIFIACIPWPFGQTWCQMSAWDCWKSSMTDHSDRSVAGPPTASLWAEGEVPTKLELPWAYRAPADARTSIFFPGRYRAAPHC